MSRHNKLVGVMMNVQNSLVFIARGLLCIFIPLILFGFLWSGGDMYPLEYGIWLFLISVFSYGIYISRNDDSRRNEKVKKYFFYSGLSVFIISLFLNLQNVIRSPNETFLIVMLVPFLIVYLVKPSKELI